MTNESASGGDGPLRRVQNAALRRALTDASVAVRHLVFAGALETARRPADRAEDDDDAVADALLASLLVHYGVDLSLTGPGGDADGRRAPLGESDTRSAPATPTPPEPTIDTRTDPRAVGAALVHARFDVGLDRAAALAAMSVGEVERAFATVERSDG